MLTHHVVTYKRCYIVTLLCGLLVLLSSCGSQPTTLLEQTRLNLETRPGPMPVGLTLNGQPCSSKICTPTAVPVIGNGNTGAGTGGAGGNGPAGNTGTTSAASVFGAHMINTGNNIHLFLTFSYNITNPASVGSAYDFVWGADTYQVAGFRSANPNIMLSYYIPFNRDAGAYGNQDLNKQHDLNYWRNAHPDWILYRCDRSTPAYFDSNVIPFDFTNPGFINWQVQAFGLPASQNGYDALATDNVNMDNSTGACGFFRNGQWVQRYTGNHDDPQWRQDIVSWMGQLRAGLHALPHPLAFIPNLDISPVSPGDPFAQQIANNVDGILDESGFTQYSQGYLTDNQWQQDIQFIKSVQQQGKPYYILNEVNDTGIATLQWTVGSYLMANERLSSIFVSGNQAYGSDLRYPAYNANIGSPTNEMYSGQNVYWRNFTNGLVVVNPSSGSSYTVNLPNGNYVDASGNHVGQTVNMGAHSGLVLTNG